MIEVAAIVEHYIPGYKAGGPIRSVSGMVDRLVPDVRFRIITRDRDHTETQSYPGVAIDGWNQVGAASVLYLSPQSTRLRALSRAVSSVRCDVVYLNSLFGKLSREYLVARRLGWVPPRPVVLAPRGELSPGAFGIKAYKKKPFLKAAKATGMLRGVLWQATSELEKREIEEALGPLAPVRVARNIAGEVRAGVGGSRRRPKRSGEARFVFISRVSPKKNLAFALRILAKIRGKITFDIFGPIDDDRYWVTCQELIRRLPEDVRVTYGGPLTHERVQEEFANAQWFVFPTSGENFGHAICEALAAGCPVVLSDTTPWGGVSKAGAGWALPLANEGAWCAALQECVDMGPERYDGMADNAGVALRQFMAGDVVRESLALFQSALNAQRTECLRNRER